ncbi:MAG: 2-amino-4-hydroxy-6-hydroxymethyldihydropteridine diphosphokinase [Paracoccaceae bacterium]|nr:2-amino-4-hydroxy-6-hydroxymethyldihydropteridine diphosphokinase [Paracoccaceae bacterium]
MAHSCAKTRIFHVALGGNVETSHGSPQKTIETVLFSLANDELRITRQSLLYDTPAFPEGSGPNFVNGVVEISTTLSEQDLLERLHDIEAEYGRKRISRWGARTLDLDILASGQDIVPNSDFWQFWHDLPAERQQTEAPDTLVLPHPRLHERAFVLVPFNDVAPDWCHPVLGLTVREMLDALPAKVKNEVKPL